MRKFWELIEWQEKKMRRDHGVRGVGGVSRMLGRGICFASLPCHFLVELVLAGLRLWLNPKLTWWVPEDAQASERSELPDDVAQPTSPVPSAPSKKKKGTFLTVGAKCHAGRPLRIITGVQVERADWQAHREAWMIHEWAAGVNVSRRCQTTVA